MSSLHQICTAAAAAALVAGVVAFPAIGDMAEAAEPPQSPIEINSVANIPAYIGFVALGFSDTDARALAAVKLEIKSSDNNSVHFVQTTMDGTTSETFLTLTPNVGRIPGQARKVRVAAGFDVYVDRAQVVPLPDGYKLVLAYFVPEDGLPAALRGRFRVVRSIEVLPLLHRLLAGLVGATDAYAEGTLMYGTGVALERTVISPTVPLAGDGAANVGLPKITPTEPVPVGAFDESRSTFKARIKEVRQMIRDRDRLRDANRRACHALPVRTPDEFLARNQKALEIYAEKQLMEKVRDRAERDAAAEALSKTAGHVVTGALTAWSLKSIFSEAVDATDYLRAKENCLDNPTNPLAIKAKKEDPNYERQRENIQATREDVYVAGSVRLVNAGLDVAATAGGASTGFLGSAAFGVMTAANDAILQGALLDSLASVGKGITPCTPPPCDCPKEPAAQSSGASQAPDAGLNYTPGLDASYTPGPARNWGPALNAAEDGFRVCRPAEPNKVVVTLRQVEEQPHLSRQAGFRASTVVAPLNGTLSVGTGNGKFLETADMDSPYDELCQQHIVSAAEATMIVHVKRDISEVEVLIKATQLRTSGKNPECGAYTGIHEGPLMQENCTFVEVDLVRGGVYRDQNYEDYSDDDEHRLNSCELDIGPIK